MRTNHIRSLLAAAISACALLALGATSASAAVTWTSGGKVGLSGTIVIDSDVHTPRTCTIANNSVAKADNGYYGFASFLGWNYPSGFFTFSCTGGTTLQMQADAQFPTNMVHGSPGNYLLLLGTGPLVGLTSPYGVYHQYTDVPFVNGAGAVKSKLVFNNTEVGTGPGIITATGTLDVNNGSTGTRTVTGSD